MIAFFHTLKSNTDKFEQLARKYSPEGNIKHFVNEDILPYALKNGQTDDATFDAEIDKIRQLNPVLIVCTCSTYGEACDRHADVQRIDRPVVDYLVKNYRKIGLAYAAVSTRDISVRLIQSCAKEQGKDIEISDLDCSAAWPYFEQKDQVSYAHIIAKTIKEKASGIEVIFLAQASMEGAIAYLTDFEKDVWASPEFGVNVLLKKASTIS